jgi:prepilin-type N-terminal cleavage/methylation domain-containing protein
MSRGFTLIECMIVLSIVGILAAIAYPALTGKSLRQTEVRCVQGYTFVLSNRGLTQLIDENGKGKKCD